MNPLFMSTTTSNKRPQSFAEKAKVRVKKHKPALSMLASKKDKTFTKKQLEEIHTIRHLWYLDLLTSARSNDMGALITFPTANEYEVPMKRVSHSLETQVELLDIFHYLDSRKENLPFKFSQHSFGPAIGIDLKQPALHAMLRREPKIRAAAKAAPPGAHYIVNRKHLMVEEILLHWLRDQRELNVPVSGRMLKEAGRSACMVLCDLEDESGGTVSEAPLSFSAWWFDSFKKRHRISYCQLHGEAGSVDLEAIEPELVEVRRLCAQYTPDTIFNCDETGMYLKELDTKSYTTPLSRSGAKAFRKCRVSVLFCINASGTSLTMAKAMHSLKPLVIAEHFTRDVEDEAAAEMVIEKTKSGWMTREVFVRWLQRLDDELSQPTLLLLDSAGSHNNVDMRDPELGVHWKHLRIQRLPKNSTSVTQPLDAGVISAFKRAFLEMLGFETYCARTFDKTKCISNGRAWTLIPHAWDNIKPSTLRNCFAKTPVLPTAMREELRRRRTIRDERRSRLQDACYEHYAERERAYFEHLIAEVRQDNGVTFKVVEHEDELAEEELHQADAEGSGQNHTYGGEKSPGDSSNREGSASSPLADTDLDTAAHTLKQLVGDSDFLTVDGIKQVWQSAKQGSRGKQRIGKAMKTLVRACATASDEELQKDGAKQ